MGAFEIFDLRRLYDSEDRYDHLTFSGVIDAGSTGTRLNIYGFNKEKMLEFYYVELIEPGVSALLSYQISQHLNFLLFNAEKRLGYLGLEIKKIPMVFLATAGLRMVSEKASRRIIREVRIVLRDYNVRKEDVKVISGAEEGMLALRSLVILKKLEHRAVKNFGCEFLMKYPHLDMDAEYCREIEAHIDHEHTYGIIDMGGGSVQVAYIDVVEEKLVSQSFLGFGLRESLRQIKKHPNYSKCRKAKSESSPHCTPVFKDLFGKAPNTKKTRGITSVNELFLASFFYEKFFKLGGSYKKTLRDIQGEFREQCLSLESERCLEVGFLMVLLRYFDFKDDTTFFLVQKVLGININWSVARARDLLGA